MTRQKAKAIVDYYAGIPDMEHLLQCERAELESRAYNALGAAAADGLPQSGTPGKPVEAVAIKAADAGTSERLREIDKRLETLAADYDAIRGCIDGLRGRYKRILTMRQIHRYSWGKIAIELEAPEGTVRYWHLRALDAIGEALTEVPTINEILGRASRARV